MERSGRDYDRETRDAHGHQVRVLVRLRRDAPVHAAVVRAVLRPTAACSSSAASAATSRGGCSRASPTSRASRRLAEAAAAARAEFGDKVMLVARHVRDGRPAADLRQHRPDARARASRRSGRRARAHQREWLSPSGRLLPRVPERQCCVAADRGADGPDLAQCGGHARRAGARPPHHLLARHARARRARGRARRWCTARASSSRRSRISSGTGCWRPTSSRPSISRAATSWGKPTPICARASSSSARRGASLAPGAAVTLGVMQPYFLPYIGYWQLLAAVDRFVVYDNIQYTKKGWINRNRFLRNGSDAWFTVPLKSGSAFLDDRRAHDRRRLRSRRIAAAAGVGLPRGPVLQRRIPADRKRCRRALAQSVRLPAARAHGRGAATRHTDADGRVVDGADRPRAQGRAQGDRVVPSTWRRPATSTRLAARTSIR